MLMTIFNYMISAIMLTSIYSIPVYPKIKYRYLFVLAAVSLLNNIFFYPLIQNFDTYILIAAYSCIIFFTQKPRILNLCIVSMAYVFSVALNYLYTMISGIIFRKAPADYMSHPLFNICFIVLNICLLFVYRYFLYQKLRVQKLIINRKIAVTLVLNALVYIFIFIWNFSYGETLGYPSYVISFNGVSFLLSSILSFGLFYITCKSLMKEARLQHQLKEYETLQEYTGNLEEAYRQMRGFRHDYANVLASITCFLQDGEYQQLEDYLNAHLLPQKTSMEAAALPVGQLSNMQLLELKSLIYTKLIRASSENIPVHLDIPRPVTASGMDPVILVRILGIFLDNALDAAGEQENPSVFLGILQQDDTLTINVKNPCSLSADQLGLLSRPGFTTKEGHTGIGLSTVKELTAPMDNVFWNTRLEEGMLVQELQITGLSV